VRVLVAAAALLVGCSAGTRSPEGAVRALAEAAAEGDGEAVLGLLGPETRARLEVDARRAAALSGWRTVSPSEMLAVGWFAPRFRLRATRELGRDGAGATVEVRGTGGERREVRCVREAGAWKVELP
jgi:hypothetical protein